MNVNEVIKYPILTEKTYAQMSDNVYTFAVDKRTNKAEVKKTVEFIFDVKVERVNIMTVNKKAKKLGRFAGFTSGYKKAVVKLGEGQINIFPEEAVAQANTEVKPKKAKKAAKTEMSAAEKKAAEKIAAKAAKKTEAKKPAAKKAEAKPAAKKAAAKPAAKPAAKKAAAKPAAKKTVDTKKKATKKEASK